MLVFYSLALVAVLVLGSPWWLLRMATSGKYREGLSERLGAVPRRVQVPASAEARVLWIHAVSVGEVLAVSQLVQRLRAEGLSVLVSTTTRTGQRLARERFGAEAVFYFPLDFRWIVHRYLVAFRPAMLVLAETEFWPNLLAECRSRQIPVVVVNARISDRSFPRYLRLRRLWRRILSGLTLVLAQSEQDVQRLRAIGAPAERVVFGGNLKFDVRTNSEEKAIVGLLRTHLAPGSQTLVCGSTLEGEEQLLLEARTSLVQAEPGLIMILAPRHPERFDTVAQLLQSRGCSLVRRSAWGQQPSPIPPGSVFLLDSIGELAALYSLGQVAFIGGSLVPAGGHNPLEPAQFAVPILMGDSYENFRAIVECLRAEEAIRIVSPADFGTAVLDWLQHPEQAQAIGQRALQVFRAEAGATDRALQAILATLSEAAR